MATCACWSNSCGEMCLLFLYVNERPDQCAFRMIIANNRDEYRDRPTGTAEFRGESQQWIGGIDFQPGKEGGSWLGMTKTGKLAVLINILSKRMPKRHGRGMLVPRFLQGNVSCKAYIQAVADGMNHYRLFKFLCADLSENPCLFHFVSNMEEDKQPRKISTGVHCYDNSGEIHTQWKKTVAGRTAFQDIVSKCGSETEKRKVVSSIIDLLTDKTQHIPDHQLAKQLEEAGNIVDAEVMNQLCAINILTPGDNYVTRTNTVILVDFDGNCDYYERTLETPVDINNPKYSIISHSFKLELSNNVKSKY